MARQGADTTRPSPPATAADTAASGRGAGNRSRAAIAAVAIIVAAGGIAWVGQRDGDSRPTVTAARAPADLASVSGQGAEAPPPWPAPPDVPDRVKAAGLPLGAMGMAEHYHVHLDVLVDGKPVEVPANVGVDGDSGQMSYLHTHSPDGLVHIEAGEVGQPFSLGQLFTQWDVKLSADRLGSLRAVDENTLRLYVNGAEVPGDPALLLLAPRQQITLVYGPKDQKVDVPSSYRFAPGD